MDPIIVSAAIELAKLGLSTYFNAMRMAQKTEQEINEMFEQEKMKFLANDPSKLEDV